ncbi:30S ribosomal protein S17 [Candidatus Woesearchaeota archaeon]|nr:30S ribosomal protein S17 [Candidatus Woesearchaeota archaeon]
MKHNIGIDAPAPKTECKDDKHCPFHGGFKLRGKMFTATVVASKMNKTATVQKTRQHYLPKYQRYEKRKSKFRVHNPACIEAKEGDEVQIMESRPISKTKRFVIINILSKNESNKK